MIDTTSYLNSITSSSKTKTASSSMGSSDYMTILCKELETQDPFNSMDATQMVGQLTQFSMLEQLTNMNTSLTSGLTALNLQTATSAANYIGKSVSATGYSLEVSSGTATSATYTLSSDATSVKGYVYNSSGSLVRTVDIGTKTSGTYSFQWDGKNNDGTTAADGTYSLAIAGKDSSGSTVTATTTVSGTVSGVAVSDGTIMLTLKDGRQVSLANVQSVTNSTSS